MSITAIVMTTIFILGIAFSWLFIYNASQQNKQWDKDYDNNEEEYETTYDVDYDHETHND